MVQQEDQKPEGHTLDSCWGVLGLFFRASCVTDYTNISSNTRVPRFKGIRDFSCLKFGIRDLKQNRVRFEIESMRASARAKYPSGLRDCTKLWVGITELKSYWGPSDTLSLSFFSSLAAKTIFTVKLAFSSMSSAQ